MSPSIPGPEISKAVRNNAAHGQTLHRAGGQLRQRLVGSEMCIRDRPYAHVVIDVGGDDTGATALGRYAPYTRALRDEMNVLYVVNPCRPFSSSVEDITGLYRLIERQARLTPDHLVNNANLQEHTTPEVLLAGQELLQQAAAQLDRPVSMIAGRAHLKEALPDALKPLFFAFEPIMKPDWLVDSE